MCAHDDARQSTVGVEFSIEIHGLIDKVLVGINYIVLTRLGKKKKKGKRKTSFMDSVRTAELRSVGEKNSEDFGGCYRFYTGYKSSFKTAFLNLDY